MITSSSSLFNVMFLSKTSLPDQQNSDRKFSDYTLTEFEALYLKFMKRDLEYMFEFKTSLCFLSYSNERQQAFKTRVLKKFKVTQYFLEELDLEKIISSIWIKTRGQIEKNLNLSGNQAALEEEKKERLNAEQELNELNLKGYSVIAFTEKEASFLLEIAKRID